MKFLFDIGAKVNPREEWRGDPNDVPSGEVKARAKWGRDGCYRVGDDHRFFAAHVFEAIVNTSGNGN